MLFVIAIFHFFYWNTQTENTQKHLDVTKVLGGNRRNGQVTHSTGSYQNKKRTVVFYFFFTTDTDIYLSSKKWIFLFQNTHTDPKRCQLLAKSLPTAFSFLMLFIIFLFFKNVF